MLIKSSRFGIQLGQMWHELSLQCTLARLGNFHHFTLLHTPISSHDNMPYHHLHVSAMGTFRFRSCAKRLASTSCYDYLNRDQW